MVDSYRFEFEGWEEVQQVVGKKLHGIRGYGANIMTDFLKAVYDAGVDAGEITGYKSALRENDIEDNEDAREVAYDEGLTDGREEGFNSGREEGYDDGMEDGENKGYDNGKEDGYEEGEQVGYDQGKSDGHDDGYDEGLEAGHDDGYAKGFEDGVESVE